MGNAPPCAFFPRSRRGCCSDRPAKPGISRLRSAPVSVYQDENDGSRGRVFHSRASGAAAGLNLPVSGKRMGRARPFKTLRRRFLASDFSRIGQNGRSRPRAPVSTSRGRDPRELLYCRHVIKNCGTHSDQHLHSQPSDSLGIRVHRIQASG